jgi:hypothetical protein
MPVDAKDHGLSHHAHFTTENMDHHAALAHLPANDPLVLPQSQDHQAHTAIDPVGWGIFGPDEDVPLQFQTADWCVSDE